MAEKRHLSDATSSLFVKKRQSQSKKGGREREMITAKESPIVLTHALPHAAEKTALKIPLSQQYAMVRRFDRAFYRGAVVSS